MPRRARLTLASDPHHVIQRGTNRDACFYANADYQAYPDWLEQYAKTCDCELHAYVLMTNHVHRLVTPMESGGLGMKKIVLRPQPAVSVRRALRVDFGRDLLPLRYWQRVRTCQPQMV